MDVVLEVLDTYLFDRVYSSLLPLGQSQTTWSPHSTMAPSAANASTWNAYEQRGAHSYKFEPASRYLSVNPSRYAYMSQLPRDNAIRQAVSLYLITWLIGMLIYLFVSSASYFLVFDKSVMRHPKFLKNQISLEIKQTLASIPVMSLLTTPFFLAEVRGHSKIYDTLPDNSWWGLGGWYTYPQFPMFLLFTDFGIYWIHRGLHHSLVYKYIHKPHHKWVMPSPFASYAFHPLDGWAQSVPYHVFPFLFPLQKFAYLALFCFIQVWTVIIHDGEFYANNPVINGAACHAIHHLEFLGNYGQFTTLFDRMGGTYRKPAQDMYEKIHGKKDQ